MAPPSPDDPLPDPLLTAIKRLRPCRSEFDPGRFVLSPVLCHPVRIIRGCSVPMRPPGFHLQASRDKPVVHFGPARCRWVEHRRIGSIVLCSTLRQRLDCHPTKEAEAMDRWHAGISSVRRRLELRVENQGAEGSRHVEVRLRGASIDPSDPVRRVRLPRGEVGAE